MKHNVLRSDVKNRFKFVACFLFLITLLSFSSKEAFSQAANTFKLTIKNDTLKSATVYEFDIYIEPISPGVDTLRTVQCGIYVNLSFMNGLTARTNVSVPGWAGVVAGTNGFGGVAWSAFQWARTITGGPAG